MFNLKEFMKGFMDAHDFQTYNADELGSRDAPPGMPQFARLRTHQGLMLVKVDDIGGEGEGDHREVTYAIVPEGMFPVHGERTIHAKETPGAVAYVQFTGSYDSYNGTEWNDEFTSVSPELHTSIVYN